MIDLTQSQKSVYLFMNWLWILFGFIIKDFNWRVQPLINHGYILQRLSYFLGDFYPLLTITWLMKLNFLFISFGRLLPFEELQVTQRRGLLPTTKTQCNSVHNSLTMNIISFHFLFQKKKKRKKKCFKHF